MNASAFYYDYKNQQISVFINTTVGAGIQNAGSSRVFGIETEGEYAISKSDRIKFSVNYLDAKINDLKTFAQVEIGNNPSVSVDLSNKRPIQAPKWTMTARYDHDFKVGKGVLNAGIQTLFKSEYFLQVYNYAMDKQASYTKTDVNLTYTGGSGKWDFRRICSKLRRQSNFGLFGSKRRTINIYNWTFGSPRLMGIQANVRFLIVKELGIRPNY